MAKKSFRGGLGSLLENTLKNTEKDKDNKPDSDELRRELIRCNEELYLWRTGKLTTELFHKSLSEQQLAYNEKTNKVENMPE